MKDDTAMSDRTSRSTGLSFETEGEYTVLVIFDARSHPLPVDGPVN